MEATMKSPSGFVLCILKLATLLFLVPLRQFFQKSSNNTNKEEWYSQATPISKYEARYTTTAPPICQSQQPISG